MTLSWLKRSEGDEPNGHNVKQSMFCKLCCFFVFHLISHFCVWEVSPAGLQMNYSTSLQLGHTSFSCNFTVATHWRPITKNMHINVAEETHFIYLNMFCNINFKWRVALLRLVRQFITGDEPSDGGVSHVDPGPPLVIASFINIIKLVWVIKIEKAKIRACIYECEFSFYKNTFYPYCYSWLLAVIMDY